MGIVRPIVQTVGGVPRRVRDLGRLREVAQILVRHGYGLLVAGVQIPGLPKRSEAEPLISTPERLVMALSELGPTFVKLGQVLSTRPDIMPPDYVRALQRLQDQVTSVPLRVVEQALADALGPDWRQGVEHFDPQPLATASIAQVHAARLQDGSDVVFKIQRPGIGRVIRSDLNILQFLVARMLAELPELDSLDLPGVLAEFETSMLAELDFHEEAANMERVAANLADNPDVRVPSVVAGLSCGTVLCMERLHGTRIREARAAGHDMALVGERYLKVAYDMLFLHGFFHGDLHPGNVMVLDDGRVGLLDFGMMGRLTTEMRNDIILIIFALQRGDYRSLTRLFFDIAVKTRRVDYAQVERDVMELMERHWSGRTLSDIQMGPFVVDLAREAAKHGARIPQAYTMFFKALVTTEGLAKTLLPEVDPIAAAEPYIRRLLAERVDLGKMQGELMYLGLTLGSMLRRLPVSFGQFLDDLDAQRVRMEIKRVTSPEQEALTDRRVNRALFTLLTVALLALGTWMLTEPLTWFRKLPVGSLVMYGLSAVAFLSAVRRGLLR